MGNILEIVYYITLHLLSTRKEQSAHFSPESGDYFAEDNNHPRERKAVYPIVVYIQFFADPVY